ncbi:proteinase inhibitor I36 SMPI [Streptomyces sp. NBC_01142]|uniref:proteinase inhibitor I36 SMPI n=1 Tax=Streptomyces sp. NBC_01142 TaxID=2975865 RepID=UPI002255B149|nr:proteinase inhibitor I36 SMPI [Streptomyces sp. NBC_01142]MCX4826263.1 proteinase inhibitor I36 SMPI [Streptomyces sp. NBC_01142]
MNFIRKTALALSAVALTTAGLAATATPAAAVGGCASGKLCLYEDRFYVDMDLSSSSTKACFPLGHYGESGFYEGIGSYVNNLSVPVEVYYYNRSSDNPYTHEATIRPGGFSSDTSAVIRFGWRGAVCTGGLNPNTVL